MAFHVTVEPETFEAPWEISDPEPEDETCSQVSLGETEPELPVDVVILGACDSHALGDEVRGKIPALISTAEFCCKVLVPSYYAGAMIGKRGKSMMQLQKLTQTIMKMSYADVFFPGTQDRMLIISAATKKSLVFGVQSVVMEMLKVWTGHAQQGHHFVFKLVVPNSAAGKIIGLGGVNAREMKRTTGCRIRVSGQIKGIKERVVVMMASKDGVLAQGVAAVLECIQDDPHLHECMNFKYGVELPLGSWDCGKPGPAEPDAELMSLEAARELSKRRILENMFKAAPRNVLVRHRLLGRIGKLLKMKTREAVLAALEEALDALGSIPEQNAHMNNPNKGILPVGLQP